MARKRLLLRKVQDDRVDSGLSVAHVNIQPEFFLKDVLSEPHSCLIANGFFRSGQIEAGGPGIEKMKF